MIKIEMFKSTSYRHGSCHECQYRQDDYQVIVIRVQNRGGIVAEMRYCETHLEELATLLWEALGRQDESPLQNS